MSVLVSASWFSEVAPVVEQPERIEDPALGELMSAHLAGEPRAFEELYQRMAPELGRYFAALARDAGLTEDLVQETFLRVHAARRSFDPALPFRPWLFAIARHVFLMSRRARARRAARETVGCESAPEPAVPSSEGALLGRRLLGQLLGRLSRERQAPLVLHHILGFDFREIGRFLGVSEGAARVRASRALAELRDEGPEALKVEER